MASPASVTAPLQTRSAGIDPRRLGLLAGLVVGGAFALVAELVDFGALIDITELPWTASTVLTGMIVGWLFGPAATRAERPRRWLAIIIGQALLAIVVGAFVIGILGGVQMTTASDGLQGVALGTYVGVLLGLVGILLYGWLIAPIAFVAAVAWSVVMLAFGRRS